AYGQTMDAGANLAWRGQTAFDHRRFLRSLPRTLSAPGAQPPRPFLAPERRRYGQDLHAAGPDLCDGRRRLPRWVARRRSKAAHSLLAFLERYTAEAARRFPRLLAG